MIKDSKLDYTYKLTTRLIRENQTIVVENLAAGNMVKKHKKANPNAGEQGGIVDQEAPIQVSNVAIWNEESEKPDRVGFRFEGDKKVRFYKSDGKEIVD